MPRPSPLSAGRRALAAFPLLGLALSLASCAPPRVEGFQALDARARLIELRQTEGFPRGEEGLFGPERRRNRFRLASPLDPAPGQDLELRLELLAGASARLSLALSAEPSGEAPFYETSLTLRDRHLRLSLPLAPEGRLASLSLALEEASSPEARIALRGLAILPAFRGYLREGESLRLSPGFSLILEGDRARAGLAEPFAFLEGSGTLAPSSRASSPPALSPSPELSPALLISYGPGASSSVPGKAGAGEASQLELRAPPGPRFRARLKSGGGLLRIPLAAFEARPERLELELPAGTELRALYAGFLPESEARVLDLGALLRSRPADPEADYDLYRWDLLPEVLVFDFRDYAVQDRYLKRLAFFVEKEGFKGRLAADREIEGLHGWNAHDYRPEDLAAFFGRARRASFPLNEEERRLERLLLEGGVLREEGGELLPGRGAIISISRESAPYLRATFITHEASHALYFVDGDFRDFVRAEWSSVPREERWFWRLYFGWMNYDTENEDLMATEYMAYLFQQPSSKVEEYFTRLLPARLLENHEELAPRIEAYLEEYGANFALRAARIEAWLRQRYELEAGRAYFLY